MESRVTAERLIKTLNKFPPNAKVKLSIRDNGETYVPVPLKRKKDIYYDKERNIIRLSGYTFLKYLVFLCAKATAKSVKGKMTAKCLIEILNKFPASAKIELSVCDGGGVYIPVYPQSKENINYDKKHNQIEISGYASVRFFASP